MSAASPDVVVVGGGLVGCACAHSLAKRGLRVTLLERGDLADGASGACDGHVCCPSKAPGLHLELARRSLELYEVLSETLGEETGFRRCGSWLVAETEAEWAALRESAVARQAAGLSVYLQSGDDVRAAEPILGEALLGGSFCPIDGQTDPWRTTLAFAHAARRLGAQLELGVEVIGVVARRGRVHGLETPSGPVPCGRVLLAAGAWTAGLCEGVGVDLPLHPRRGEILVTEPMPPLLSSIVLHAPYVSAKLDHADEARATLVLEQTADGNVLVGSTRSFAGFDPRNTPEGIGAIASEAARLAPKLADLHVIRCFAGLRPCSGDGLPLLGPVPGVEGLFVATGHEGDGVALAPVTGELVADGLTVHGGWLPELLPEREPQARHALPTR